MKPAEEYISQILNQKEVPEVFENSNSYKYRLSIDGKINVTREDINKLFSFVPERDKPILRIIINDGETIIFARESNEINKLDENIEEIKNTYNFNENEFKTELEFSISKAQ